MSIQQYYLGCPLWSNRDWTGRFFNVSARPANFLRQYSSVFNTVEGNTTFYALPTADTVIRWRNETPESFHFSCKFSRAITHDRRLRHTGAETREFFKRLSPLADRLGPFM
ncbi:MAG: DUF72 domain-containing protein, partial [Candidatus Competibacteraceae bacterium]|nr:DUF72 domain-containing protein [Candidatus Competibacteraceae bacterium]